ncbi:hypothetical protein LCGC14_2142160 [marine sediment metagenome]|uniref:Uncharacterized protein n=1 Tax=marine sediment metagenome TaxID=412755 RepID=A0A0F9GB48_9ZZZZ
MANIIEGRILAEKRKHSEMDWIKIASLKIARDIIERDNKAITELVSEIERIAPRHKPDFTSLEDNRKSNWKLCNCKVCSKINEILELIKSKFNGGEK